MHRMNYKTVAPEVYAAMLRFHESVSASGLEPGLLDLVYLKASQINGCAFCIDMHWKALRGQGESEQKLYMLDAWREWDGLLPRERAALEWTEAVTRLRDGRVEDAVYASARGQFTEGELAALTLAIVAINGWNRLNVAFRITVSQPTTTAIPTMEGQSA